jgi:hypothetical protein
MYHCSQIIHYFFNNNKVKALLFIQGESGGTADTP